MVEYRIEVIMKIALVQMDVVHGQPVENKSTSKKC